MSSATEIKDILKQFSSITLAEMEAVKLMNRIDTKYVVTIRQLPILLNIVKADYFVQEIDGIRLATYDTIYYDTEELDMYIRHHNRQLVRQKIRIRQYVDSNLTFLEIKSKNNKGRTKKKRIRVEGFCINESSVEQDAKRTTVQDFIASKSWYKWEMLAPKLRTTFHRITLVNKAKTERLTIDHSLVWTNLTTDIEKTYSDLVIVELKRDGNHNSPMINIMQQMRIRPLKISKYCVGTAITAPQLKRNRFKTKIRKIEKLLATK